MINRVAPSFSLPLHTTSSTLTKQSAKNDFASTLRQAASNGATALGRAAGVAAPYVPGAAAVSAALHTAANSLTQTPGIGGYSSLPEGISTPAESALGQPLTQGGGQGGMGDVDGVISRMNKENTFLIAKQQEIHNLAHKTTMVSNVLKAKHDSANTVITNVR